MSDPMPAPTATTRVRLHVEDHGSGRPLVLIHGWPLSAEAWKPQTEALVAAGYRVVAYDRRGFGRSEPGEAWDYDTLADDLAGVLEDLDLRDATLLGFSMGGGEVARYLARHGSARVHSVIFAAAVPPYLLKTADNPDGPLEPDQAAQMEAALQASREAFFEGFTRDFFSAHGELKVTEAQRQEALALCLQSDPQAALGCMRAWAGTDFRQDLRAVDVPALVLHGDADATVPLEGSGQRTHQAIPGSELAVLQGAPHGCNVSHADAFNGLVAGFLGRAGGG